MSERDEEILISIIIDNFADIEEKTTNHSLGPKMKQMQQAEAWDRVRVQFFQKTNVSFFVDKITICCSTNRVLSLFFIFADQSNQ